jgi:uncharacterized protein YbjQ (UPF0145 family)
MHTHFTSQLGRAAVVIAVLAGAAAVHARNDKLMLPIDPALRIQGARQVLGPDVQLRFGKATAVGTEIVNAQVEAHGVGDPFGGVSNNNNGGRRDRVSDEQVCMDAFRKAVVELQRRARSAGASAVVGIVGNYNKVEMDSRDTYECHVGHTRAVVDLKGQAARAAGQAQVSQPQPAQAQPVAAGAAVPVAVPLIATGFANINDIDAIPYLSDKGREAYRLYLGRPTPKAFALSPSGHWFSAWTLIPGEAGMPTDPLERAVLACNRTSPTPCKLYAVNGAVVWSK